MPTRIGKETKSVYARWEHNLVVIYAQGNITEQWTQWDTMLKRPHPVYISPYDPQKNVWMVDDSSHALLSSRMKWRAVNADHRHAGPKRR
jgi:hypothetical protein